MDPGQQPKQKYSASTRRDLSTTQSRGLAIVLVVLAVVLVVVLLLAFLVATGEINLR